MQKYLERLLRAFAEWVVPYRIFLWLSRRRWRAESGTTPNGLRNVSVSNDSRDLRLLLGRHAGERCFIVCNGPSLRTQNLSQLRGEIVFTVSNGYLLPEYSNIAPSYHCVPQVTYGEFYGVTVDRERTRQWFSEMDQALGDAQLFLMESERALVEEGALFKGRQVRYLEVRSGFEEIGDRIVDVADAYPGAQSVSVMSLMLAMYMGFQRIYLLGADHDWLQKGTYQYAFRPTIWTPDNGARPEDYRKASPMYEELEATLRLWKEYRALSRVASANGIEIFNATNGGNLDEFPRVEFASVLAKA